MMRATSIGVKFRHVGIDPRIALAAPSRRIGSDEFDMPYSRELQRLDGSTYLGEAHSRSDHAPSRPACCRADRRDSSSRPRSFKLNVRKLKALGLTESLEVGYRLSPRGRTVLARLGK